MKSNRAVGNAVEQEFCDILFGYGWWSHNLKQNSSGQPADVIAVKNEKAFLIDCKDCAGGKFELRRVEDNQITAMEFWQECGNDCGWFALRLNGKFYMLSSYQIPLGQTQKSLSADEIRTKCLPLEKWVEVVV